MTRRLLLDVTPVAALALAAGATAGPNASPTPATLLARHVPVLVLHPAEQVLPTPVDGFLADADLQRRGASGWEKADGPLPRGGAELRLDQRSCVASDGPAATPCYVTAEAAHAARPVVYGAALRRKELLELQYWIWYPWDVYSPTVPPGELWQVHEGDWESVSVIVDMRGRPLHVAYSQHGEGVRRTWATAPKQGLRPVAYVALGSHANYPTPGTHAFDPRVVDPLFISVIRQNGGQPADHTGRGRVVRPTLVRVGVTSPSWMAFAGGWGEDGYLRVPNGQPTPYAATGPKGPAFHEQWRAPVREALSWPQS